MSGRPRTVHRQVKRPRQRTPISAIPEPERSRCLLLAEVIQALLKVEQQEQTIPEAVIQNAANTLDIAPYRVVQCLSHFRNYHLCYQNEHPANAFTQLLPSKSLPKSSQTKHTRQPESSLELPLAKRPHIMTVLEPQRTEIIMYAHAIAKLIALQDDNFGRLPDGKLDEVALKFGKTANWINTQMRHLRLYRETFGHDKNFNDANAFVPIQARRPEKRMASQEIIDFVDDAVLNTEWPSLNGDGSISTVKNAPIQPKELRSLIEVTFLQRLSKSQVWRLYNDARKRLAVAYAVARRGLKRIQILFQTKKRRVQTTCEVVQMDIRPLPIVVSYKGIECTVQCIILMDEYSNFRLAWDLLPSKRLDTDEEVVGQTFTAQHIRSLVAEAMLTAGKRFTMIYVDNGSQFSKASLGPYMQFLVAPHEPQTILRHRRFGRPRGGGKIERTLGLVEGFLRFRPGYILEEDYRQSLENNKKVNVRTYEQFIEDFDPYMHFVNHDTLDNQLSHYERFITGPQFGLTLPAEENLAMFAITTSITRSPNPNGFRINDKNYIPIDMSLDMEIMNLVARAKKDPTIQIPIQIARFGPYEIVLFSLDNKITWHHAIDKSLDTLTRERHVQRLKQIEAEVIKAGHRAAEFLRPILDADRPIILNGLRKRPTFQHLDEAQHDLDVARNDPTYTTMPVRLNDAINTALTTITNLSREEANDQKSDQSSGKKTTEKTPRKRVNRREKAHAISQSDPTSPKLPQQSQATIVQTSDTVEDIATFLQRLNQNLDHKNSQEK